MESKEASLSGSSYIKTPILNSDTNVIEKPNLLNKNSSSVVSGTGGYDSVSSDDDGGFVSGEELFETASEKPVLADPDDEIVEKSVIGEGSGDRFVSSSINDAEKGQKVVGVLEGGGVVEEYGGVARQVSDEKPQSVVVNTLNGENSNEMVKEISCGGTPYGGLEEDKVDSEGLSLAVKEMKSEGEVEESKFKGEEDKKVEEFHGESSENGLEAKEVSEVVEEVAVESDDTEQVSADILEPTDAVKVASEGDSVVEAIHVELSEPGVAVVREVGEKKVADGIVKPEDNAETVKESAAEYSSTDQVKADVVGPTDSELVEANGVKVTPEGDSVVEDIHVDLSGPGVAVVGETEEKEEADGILKLSNDSDQVKAESVEVSAIQDSSEANGVKFTPEGDSVVEDIHVDASGPGVAVVGEMKEKEEADGSVVLNDESDQVIAEFIEQTAVENSRDDHLIANIDEPKESELVEAGGVKFTPEGDSVVEHKNVNLSGPRVAVVGNMEENGEAEVRVEKIQENEKKRETQVAGQVDYEAKQNGSVVENPGGQVEVLSTRDLVGADAESFDTVDGAKDPIISNPANEEEHKESTEPISNHNRESILEQVDEIKIQTDEASEGEDSASDGETDAVLFGSSESAKQYIEELEPGAAAESSRDYSQGIDGQIATDSDEEVDTDEEGEEGKELFDSAALAALLKAATGAGSDGGNITISAQDGSRLFSVERPAGLGSSIQSLRSAPRANRSSFLTPSGFVNGGESDNNLSEEEKSKLEKLQAIRVKFLRLVQRLGLSPDESVASQVLYRLALVAGRQTSQLFGLDDAKRTALWLEEDEKEDLDFSLNILVIGKSGVGKSATINAIFGEEKACIDAFQPTTSTVKEITGMVDGVKIRVLDTPGLKSSVMEQSFNRSVLSSVQKLTKKKPIDIVLYVDRLDAQTRDLNDLPMLRTVTSSLGPSIWRSAIVTLTHGASAPPDGPSGSPLSYDGFVTQRSHVLQQSIGQAVGDLRMMSPSLMNPVSLVENHPSCRKNREGQKVLPNGQSWRPQLMLLCYSMKILAEANSLSKSQDPFDHRKLFGFRSRAPPLPYMLSSMLQSRAHPKLASEQGGDNGDSDVDLADLSDSDQEEDEDEYDQLPPFKPLRKAQLAKLSKEQRKAYFEEYDYRVKLLQKKQWREELKRMKEMKKKGKDAVNDYGNGYPEDDPDSGAAAPVSVPLPDMALPPSFDGDNPAHRYRFLEPTSQFLARPVLDTHGWDHDCGYDGVNIEQSLTIANQFPGVISVQLTKDKKEFTINLDSSASAKHGDNCSSMAGFDIQAMGKQLAYIFRGETKFKILKKNKTAAGISITLLGENVVTGLKVEDQITIGKQYSIIGSAGTVRSQQDTAYGANIEVQRRELDYPIGQVQSSFGLSIIKWRGDLALGFNSLAQFSLGRSSKVAVRAGINNKMSGQITVRTSSSEHLSLALASVIPAAIAIYKRLYPGVGEKYALY